MSLKKIKSIEFRGEILTFFGKEISNFLDKKEGENMLNIQLDNQIIEQRFLEELKKRLDQIERRKTLWDMKELCKQTSMSENTIKEKFFYDERFQKYKIGGKWYFPSVKTECFLLMWIKEQPIH